MSPRLAFGVPLAIEATEVLFPPVPRAARIEKPERFRVLEMVMVEDTLLGIAHPFDDLEVAINEPQIAYPITSWPVPAVELESGTGTRAADGQRRGMRPRAPLLWEAAQAIPKLSRFAVEPVFECPEEPETIEAPAPRQEAVANVVAMPEGRRWQRLIAGPAGKVIAAVLIFSIMWAVTGRIGRSRRNLASRHAVIQESSLPAVAPQPPASAGRPEGRLAKVRKAIAERAGFESGENFQHGMRLWETGRGPDPPDWERSPEGYVRPGSLALFGPSLKLADYHLEFSAQVEKKGIGWAVRAKDAQNYYAMKIKVLQTGPRPVIAIVHYAVVGGKAGHRVETPLALMVHNHTPVAVAVTVKGNQFRVSIDGEEVDSWSDDALAAGGVGFFADAGDRAQLYWLKITGNDDWLGRLCSMLSAAG